MVRKGRWLGVVFMGLILLVVLALAGQARTVEAAGEADGWVVQQDGVIVIPPSANRVVRSPEELAAILRQGGVDEAAIQQILEFERRVDEAHRQGLSMEEIRRLTEQWSRELFPGPAIPEAPVDRSR